MAKAEIKQLLIEQIESYEKMIEENQDKMIALQLQISGYKDVNISHMKKVKEIYAQIKRL